MLFGSIGGITIALGFAGSAALVLRGYQTNLVDAAVSAGVLLFGTALVGTGAVVLALWETSWIIRTDSIAKRYGLRGIGRPWQIEFAHPQRLEIVHEMWRSGRGSTDELLLVTNWDRISIYSVQQWLESWNAGRPPPIDSVTLALARYFAWRSGLRLAIREYGVEQPDDPD